MLWQLFLKELLVLVSIFIYRIINVHSTYSLNTKCTYLKWFLGDTLETITAELDVAGGSLKNYVKTRWTTVYDSAASVIRLETSLKEVID